MSDYKRFVSYIYGYEQGEKRESVGFVKVNARGDECKIWVHLKRFYVHGQKPYQIYVFTQNRERLEGWPLGELESRNGALEWNGVTKTDSLMGSGFSLEESRGLYIEGAGHVFAAEWDDYPVDVERFRNVKGSARQETVEEPEEENIQVQEVVKEPVQESVPESTSTEALMEEEKTESEIQIRAAELAQEPEGFDSRQSQWSYLTRHFPVMQYVDGDAVISSIRLIHRDLNRVPRDKWELGNNSFLLHGFYQYQHLLLLRRQTEEEVQYLLGVPGIYNEQEQMMASMFGFQEFKVIKGPGAQSGNFGYWCRILN